MFDLQVALGQIDDGLHKLVKYVVDNEQVRKIQVDKWDPSADPNIDMGVYQSYKGNYMDYWFP